MTKTQIQKLLKSNSLLNENILEISKNRIVAQGNNLIEQISALLETLNKKLSYHWFDSGECRIVIVPASWTRELVLNNLD